ncbi:MAG: hypothetical protein N3G20_10595 [Verrucomicrobiae bacterium]|nr:hypothetical protein [Verrucomicrobiae bacterium]
MFLRVILCALCLAGGSWLLFYAERIQLRINAFHEDLKRTSKASKMRLRITSANYELWLRMIGALLVLMFLALVIDTGLTLERYR